MNIIHSWNECHSIWFFPTSVVCVFLRLSATFVCRRLGVAFICHRDVAFIYVRMI